MLKFHFIAKVEVAWENSAPGLPSKLTHTNFFLDVSPNLKRSEYIDDKKEITQEGLKMFTTNMVAGLHAAITLGQQKGWWIPERQFENAVRELHRMLELNKTGQPEVGYSTFDHPKDFGRKSTDKELVQILKLRNTDGRYDELIDKASKKWFHDFKAPDEAPALPKILLCEMLAAFPELSDIRQDVMNDVYDEAPDDEDMAALSKALMQTPPKK